MDIKSIPISVVGPGSQPADPDDQGLVYMNMPGDMAKYVRPPTPEPADVLHLEGAHATMRWLRQALAAYGTTAEPMLADLTALDTESRELVNQILGEGEVSVTYTGAGHDDGEARTQESVLAGVWRTFYFDGDGRVSADFLEVADVPRLARLADERAQTIDTSDADVPPEIMNALPILVELQSRLERYQADGITAAINLTLLPISEPDAEFLDERLGRGPIDVLSRAYGKCQVVSTATANVWWVRYYNSLNTLILNTLEVVDVPRVVSAAPEDLADSRVRLDEILAPYWSGIA